MSDYNNLPKTKEAVQDIDMLAYENYCYKKDYRLKTWLNSVFGMEAITVFVTNNYHDSPVNVDKGLLDWSGESILIFTSREKWVSMTNSEWATISKVK
jgi:hypothetical protein